MKICFLDNTKFEYSYKDVHSPVLRGAENILINITQYLTKMGYDITVYNNCDINTHKENSNWFNINHIDNSSNLVFDFAISNGDAKLLDRVCAKKISFFHTAYNLSKNF